MPVKNLKFLKVQFDTQIAAYEVSAFRGAIIDKVGREDTLLFHNHIEDAQYNYAYPLIQYKCLHHKPSIICLGEGVEEIHKFFGQPSWNLMIGDKRHEMKIDRLDLNQFKMQTWDKDFLYSIRNWLPITQKNYQEYTQLEGIADKVSYLEHKLVGHLMAFARGIDWFVEKEIKVKIIEYKEPHMLRLKGIKMMAFNLKFKTNVFIPNYLGLGKSVSLGFGVVQEVKDKR
jgi:hypothetical protein